MAEKAGYDQALEVPRISGALYSKNHNKLRQAFPVAVDHLRNNPECRDLIVELSADGLEKLSMTLYRQSTMMLEKRFCRDGAAAFTVIESPQVLLCKRFASLGEIDWGLHFEPGSVLGDRYQIRALLGCGGLGEVWHAFDLKLRVEGTF
jgi:hypothetical protein